jgi:hypothetical protein
MNYELVLSGPGVPQTKDFTSGEEVLIQDLSTNYPVYLFYFPEYVRNLDLENRLEQMGKGIGGNLMVHVGSLGDPLYEIMSRNFSIERVPVVILTAKPGLASSPEGFQTAYVKIDKRELIYSLDLIMQCIQELFHSFLTGNFSQAMKQARKYERRKLLTQLKKSIIGSVNRISGELWGYIKSSDIVIQTVAFKLEIKRTGR